MTVWQFIQMLQSAER